MVAWSQGSSTADCHSKHLSETLKAYYLLQGESVSVRPSVCNKCVLRQKNGAK